MGRSYADNHAIAGHILPVIVTAQFACVSLWFAGNGVMASLLATYELPDNYLGHLTTAVQAGFIAGTLFYALLALADRFSPSKVFFISSLLASASNLGLILADGEVGWLLLSRLLTGFFLAGIYPVGMKIASDYFADKLGKALGYLLGALVLGTAFPHLLKGLLVDVDWKYVIVMISALAVLGGAMVLVLIPNGPYRIRAQAFRSNIISVIFRHVPLRGAALGYFGHMWELYAFWTFVPFVISHLVTGGRSGEQLSMMSFSIIAIGSIACMLGGYAAYRSGSFRVALFALAASCLCCIFSPLIFTLHPVIVYVFLLFWGMVVIMDSPQFSTLIARSAPQDVKGSALTMINCIGFTITIVSIQLLTLLTGIVPVEWLYIFLFPGPALGVWAMIRSRLGQGIIQKSIP